MKKVLIITYYWPPSGGAGVQRWLKLSKYLSEKGMEVHVLTVDEKYASYMQTDTTLLNDISPNVTVHKTKSFEPINYYARLVGKKNVPVAGFSNVNNRNIAQKLINSIRSNFFIPDPRRGWNRFARKKAMELIASEQIDTVITTSPPHSAQLIGLSLKKKTNITWLADLRDLWTDIYYYPILGHSFLSRYIDRRLEKKVLLRADKLITVGHSFKTIFLSKYPEIAPEKITVIPNGYDPVDFSTSDKPGKTEEFTICYTGTMSDRYQPEVFFEAVRDVLHQSPGLKLKIQLVGYISERIKAHINHLQLPCEFIDTVPHSEVTRYQQNANLLLLVTPEIQQGEGIIPGKLFEYLATKNKILAIGPKTGDVAGILKKCRAGKTFSRADGASIRAYLTEVIHQYKNGVVEEVDSTHLHHFSRPYQAAQVMAML